MLLPSFQISRMWTAFIFFFILSACRSDKVIGVRHEPPSVQIVEPANESTFYAFDATLFTAQVESLSGDSVTEIEHQWVAGDSVVCDWEAVPSDGFATCSIVFEDPGSFSVTVTVKDARLDTATSTVSVEIIGNEPPSITITSPADGSFYSPDDVIEMTASVADPEDAGEDLRVSGTSNVDGDLGLSSLPSSAGDWAANIEGLASGNHLITLTVTDTTGQSGTASITLSVNGKPTAPEVTITPNPSPSGERLTAEIVTESIDPEGEPVSYEYQWIRDGAAYPSDEVSAVIPSGITQRDEYWEVIAIPRDPHGSGDPGTASITIGNSPPQVESVTIDPFTPRTENNLTAVASGWFDQDGDTENFEYEWEINGEVDPDAETETLPSSKTVRGDNVRVTVTPIDGFESGEPVSSSLFTIENTPPTDDDGIVTIIPEEPEPNDSLSCAISDTAEDADGEALMYVFTWYVDGTVRPEYTTTTPGLEATVPWGETENGETWVCEVYADDGTDTGPTITGSVYISDGTTPDPPVFADINEYRNKDSMDLSGFCEPGCTLDFECVDDTRTFPITASCTSSGTFSVTVEPLMRGLTTTCSGTCTDAAGNTSGPSTPPAVTTVCDPEDVYENGSYGDDISDPVDEWASLPDSGTETVSITGNLLDDDEDDWYIITATDDVAEDLADGYDNFRFEAALTEGTGSFNFVIYRDDGEEGSSSDSCMPDSDGYTEYSWFYETRDDGTFRGLPSGDLDACDAGSEVLNTCEDNTADFFIHVKRNPSVLPSCAPYSITVTNGE